MRFTIISVLCMMFSVSVSATPLVEEPELIFNNRLSPLSIFNPPKEPELVFTRSFSTTLRLKHYEDDRKVKLYWYAINVLDVYTTYRGLRSNDSLIELNPLLPKRPSLAQLVLHKTLLLTVYDRLQPTQKDYRYLNFILTGAVINNYSLY